MSTDQLATRTWDEIASAISALRPAEWGRLKRVAAKFAAGRPIEPEDLLQEAMMRAAESRTCPSHIDVVRFLAGTMRSIAHDESEKCAHRLVLVPFDTTSELPAEALATPDPVPVAETSMIAEEDAARVRRAVLALFDDDFQAQQIAKGIMEEITAEELRELTGLSSTAYNSKRRLIRRRIDKAFPRGWKP